MLSSSLDARRREMAVLRVAHATGAGYERAQHERLARTAGVTDREIDVIANEEPVSSLDEEGNLICRVADEVSRNVRLSDDALERIIERYGPREAGELILLVSYYNMVSRFLESTRVELEDEPPIGWQGLGAPPAARRAEEWRMRLEGKAGIVVGAGQSPGQTVGTGRAAAILFAREGAKVLLADRDLASAQETAEMIADAGGTAECVSADWTSAAECRAMAAACVDAWGRIDFLQNNVGIGAGDGDPAWAGRGVPLTGSSPSTSRAAFCPVRRSCR